MEKSNFKKLLATASAFAVITGAATGASATDFETTGAGQAVALDTAVGGANTANTNSNATQFKVGDSFTFKHANNDVTSSADLAIGGGGVTVEVNNQTGATWEMLSDINFKAINATGGANTMTLKIADAKTATLLGGFEGLGDVTLDGAAAGLTFENGLTNNVFAKDIKAAANNNGVLTVSAGTNVSFTGNVGTNGNALATITLNDEASFSKAVFAQTITAAEKVSFAELVTGDATVTKEATFTKGIAGDLTSAANTADISVGTAAAAADVTGALDLALGGKAEVIGNVTGLVTAGTNGDATKAATITVSKDANGANGGVTDGITAFIGSTVGVAGNVTVANTANGAGITADGENTAVTVTGNVTSNGNGIGVVTTDKAAVTVTGNVTTTGTGAAIDAKTISTVTVTGNVTSNNGNAAGILADAEGTKVTVTGDVSADAGNSAINATNKAQVILTGNVTQGDVDLDTAAQVTVTGNIAGAATLTAANDKLTLGKGTSTGAVNNAGQIYITGDRVFANANATANHLGKAEVQDTAEKVTFGAVDGLSGATLTTTGEAVHDIILTESQTLAAGTEIGTEANQFRNIEIANTKTLTLANEKTYAAVTAANANNGTLVFNNNNGITTIRSIGTNAKPLALVTFTENATVAGDAYAEQMQIATGKTATLGGVVETSHANGVRFTGAGAGTAVFKDGTTLNAVITTANANNGTVTFEGAATISNAIAANGQAVDAVNFNGANKTVEVGGNIYANTGINIDANATAKLTKDIAFESTKTVSTDGIIDVQSYKLSHAGEVELKSDSNIVKSTLTSNASTKDLEGGTIVITGALNKVANGKLILNIDDTGVKRKQGGGRTFKVITNTLAGNLTDADVTITGWNRKAASYTVKIVNPGAAAGEVLITDVDLAGSYFGKKFGNTAMFNKLAALADGTDGAEFLGLLSDLDSTNSAKAQEAHDRVRRGSVVSESLTTAMDGAALNNDARMGEVSAPSIQTASSSTVTGVAAGDDAARFGAWASPFYGRVNQSARNGFSGYKNEAYGLTVGLDTKVNEDLVLGVSVSAAHSNIKHKDTKSGDRTKVDTLLFSLYHTQAISANWFLSGTMTFASNDVNNTAKRNIANGYETASAKYSVTSFDLKEMVGYNYAMEAATITPMIGAKYTRVNNASYKESGATFQNFDIATKAFDKLEAIAGGKITGNAYDVNGISVTPEAHAFIQYDLLNRTQKQSVSLSGVDLDATTDKTARMKYNLGLGVSSKYGAMEYGAGYDLQLASKRVGHQGSLKVRVNF